MSGQRHIRTYIVLYEHPDGNEDVQEIYAQTDAQAEYYAKEMCEERNCRLLAVEWAMNRHVVG
ncbi:MAG: hypothetical protein K6A45_02870 [Lachnospiraceae bacterium]|nr:hypothetical protein [Lachnospiraceae bacterium]